VYGAVVDSACLVWEMASGERGACRLYDSDVFRRFYHGELLTDFRNLSCCRDHSEEICSYCDIKVPVMQVLL
jgi:hypothetical protein